MKSSTVLFWHVRSWKLQENGVGGAKEAVCLFLTVHKTGKKRGRCRHSPISLKITLFTNGTLQYCCPGRGFFFIPLKRVRKDGVKTLK